ncbi:MAG: hypothetical protein LBV51_02965 [Acholeplasmatales bacterium]|jgi:hypothetical protein|nr:hypothetical protein [Acholeplasmatales bacterium]
MRSIEHAMYILISFIITGGILYLFTRVKKDNKKYIYMKITSVLAFAVMIFEIYAMYTTNGETEWGKGPDIYVPLIFPIYPCNLNMYILLFYPALLRSKNEKFRNIVFTYMGYVSSAGAIFSLFLHVNIERDPHLTLLVPTFIHLLSHSFLLLGSLAPFFFKWIKPRVYNIVPIVIGITFAFLWGLLMALIVTLLGKDTPNAMWIFEGIDPRYPWLNGWVMAAAAIPGFTIVNAVIELIFVKKNERFKWEWFPVSDNKKAEEQMDVLT